MASFNNRVFGSNIHPSVRNKLRARQSFAESSKGDVLNSIQMKDIDNAGEEFVNNTIDLVSELGERNFKGSNTGESLFELGSRTPWTRMWTGVEFYYFEKGGQVGEDQVEEIKIGEKLKWVEDGVLASGDALGGIRSGHYETEDIKAKQIKKKIKKDLTVPLKGTIYQLGNNIYNNFNNNSISSIFESKDSSIDFVNSSTGLANASAAVDSISNKYLYPEGKYNEFQKPGPGITSVSSTTDGPMGAVKRTNVSFIVHNFHDYENIYQRYFLKPGAFVVIDFGWDTSQIYDPQEVIKHGAKFIDHLFTDGGVVEKSKGDLEITAGYVTDFDSKVNDDGSFECNIEVTSATEGLLDKQITDSSGIKNKFVNGIVPYLVNKASYLNGNNWQFLRKNWADNTETLEASKNFAEKFASTAFGSYGKDINIGERALKSGIYFQSYSERDNSVNSTDGKLYVSWGFFEDEMLNAELKLKYGNDIDFGAEFNSMQTFIKYDDNLILRQNVPSIYTDNKNLLKFLYPDEWNDTYNQKIINDKKIVINRDLDLIYTDVSSAAVEGPEGLPILNPNHLGNSKIQTITESDKQVGRIPLRELFIDVEIIKNAFNTNNNINDAIKQILDELNEYSYNVFNLKLTVNSRDDSTLGVVDSNTINLSDKFEDIMIFKPHSKGSMVKSMNLTYSTPKNDVQNMVAIQGTGVEHPISIDSLDQDIYQGLRMLTGASSTDFKDMVGIRNIPNLDNNKIDKESDLYKYEYNFEKPDTRLLYGDDDSKSVKTQYENILTELPTNIQDELLESDEYKGLDDFEIDLDVDEDKDVEKVDEDDGIDEGVTYVSSIEEYFGKKSMLNIIKEKKIPINIPYNLTLSIYGISSIFPGDIFTVDYLPKYYRDNVYFQTTKVSHEITVEGWVTTLESQMWVRPDKRVEQLYNRTKTFLHPKYFDGKLPSALKESFKNFDITTKGTDNIMVITCTAKKDKSFKVDVKGNYNKSALNTGIIKHYFMPGSPATSKSQTMVEGAKHTGLTLFNLSNHPVLEAGKKYHAVIFSKGAFVFSEWDGNYLITIDSIIKDSLGKSYIVQQTPYKVEELDDPYAMCDEYYNLPNLSNMSKVKQKKYCQETLGKNKYCVWEDTVGFKNSCEPIK